MLKKIVLTSMSLVILSGCYLGNGSETVEPTEETTQAMNTTNYETDAEEYKVAVEDGGYVLSLYEPPKGCYIGSHIVMDENVNHDIEEFEKIAGEHAIYKYYLNINEEFPEQWILSCMSLMKTPYVVLDVMDSEGNIEYKKVEEMAKKFEDYYIPIFVQFGAVDVKIPAEKYIESFRETREIFKKYASNVAFVWTIDIEDVNVSSSYYPGDDWVDWVGINIMETLSPEKEYYGDIFNGLDYFYYTFQSKKPIMISSLGVSHLNESDFIYRTTPAALEIERVYEKIEKDYKRVKGIIYMDTNTMESGNFDTKDDFTITTEENITSTYKEAVDGEYFISQIDMVSNGEVDKEYYKSPFKAYKIGEDFYLSENILIYDLGIDDVSKFQNIRTVNGEKYYEWDEIAEKEDKVLETIEDENTIILSG